LGHAQVDLFVDLLFRRKYCSEKFYFFRGKNKKEKKTSSDEDIGQTKHNNLLGYINVKHQDLQKNLNEK
jgi:hypothetical protein